MDEITESAKAVQEVAKTTGQTLNIVDKLGSFFAKVMGESIDSACGMLADTLKYKRWERQLTLVKKAEKLIQQKGLADNFRSISPKLALPIFHHASLEDEEALHDLWSQLLVSALDPDMEKPRNSFIDILKQLDSLDVKVLHELYCLYLKEWKEMKHLWVKGATNRNVSLSTNVKLLAIPIRDKLSIKTNDYWSTIDNLKRLGLCQPYVEIDKAATELYDGDKTHMYVVSSHGGYDVLCITPLGIRFVRACTYPD